MQHFIKRWYLLKRGSLFIQKLGCGSANFYLIKTEVSDFKKGSGALTFGN